MYLKMFYVSGDSENVLNPEIIGSFIKKSNSWEKYRLVQNNVGISVGKTQQWQFVLIEKEYWKQKLWQGRRRPDFKNLGRTKTQFFWKLGYWIYLFINDIVKKE